MLVSMNWIGDFVDLSGQDVPALIHRFTLSTAEVEDIFIKGADTRGVIVARIVGCEPHPNSKKLHLLKVDTGKGIVDCVCGAPNARTGLTVAFATAGGSVCGHDISEATVAGYVSQGMCCSEAELGISADHSGLMELPDTLMPGTDFKTVCPMDDIVFEVDNKSLTNRPDLWGHYGIAREFSALTGRPLRPVETLSGDAYAELPPVDITVDDREHCLRYSGLKVENISVKTSPLALRVRLFYCGLRAINLLADLTNYVMLELGQPMHAFDLKKVDRIEVRRFDKPFGFTTLDGVERAVDENTLMICSDGKPVAVAGVMGGLDSEITDQTDSLLLESACFDAVSVRKTSARLALRTDASMRYEKTLDPELTEVALGRLLKLLTDCDPGVKVASRFTDCYVRRYPKIALTFDQKYVDRYTGIKISTQRILTTLRALGFEAAFFNDAYTVHVPSWRATKDVTINADIIEEISRIYGYDNFTIVTTRSALRPVRLLTVKADERAAKQLLSDKYLLHEVHSYIWCDGRKYKKLGLTLPENVRVINGSAPENTTLRDSMIPTLLGFVSDNRGFGEQYGIYEQGRVCAGTNPDGSCNERRRLGIVLYERGGSERELYYTALRIVTDLVGELRHQKAAFAPTKTCAEWQHPRNTAAVSCGGAALGSVALLHPSVAEKIDKNAKIAVIELDMDDFAAVAPGETVYAEPSKFPGIEVDLSLLPGEVSYAEMERLWLPCVGDHFDGARVTDVYEGVGGRSVTVRFTFCAPDRTLTREEVEPCVAAVIAALAGRGVHIKE